MATGAGAPARRAEGAGLPGGGHRLCKPAHLCLDSVCEHAGNVVPPRVSVDRAAGFIVAALLGPGVEEVAVYGLVYSLRSDPGGPFSAKAPAGREG